MKKIDLYLTIIILLAVIITIFIRYLNSLKMKETANSLIEKCKEAIKGNDPKSAIDMLLSSIFINEEYYDVLLIQSSTLLRLERDKMLGTIDGKEYDIRRSKIDYTVLQVVGNVRQK